VKLTYHLLFTIKLQKKNLNRLQQIVLGHHLYYEYVK